MRIGTYESLSSKSHVWANHILATVGTQVAVSSEYKRKRESQLLALGTFSRLTVEAFSDSLHISISRCLGTQSQQGLQGVSQ